ncbi:MAG: efflux RND transporter periplasmic adaptor subunit [Acidobacteria bacterium]|nr:efflux RND transporter periplasmic adaptor subunit [Acidobacteriota bacterium]
MNSRERHLVIGGIAIGLIGAAVVAGMLFVLSRPASNDHADHVPAAPEAAVPPPQPQPPESPAVQLSGDEQRAIGVETSEVKFESFSRELTAPGRVEQAETALSTISARVGGRIDRLFVNFTGQSVQRDQPLALIYSPAVVTTAEEYRLALDNRQRLAASKELSAIAHADELVQASRRRLELWGLNSAQINALTMSPETPIHITTFSTVSGIVISRNVTEGQYVSEGETLFTVADLSAVWVKADIYESDIADVRIGQSVSIISPAAPGTTLRGRVDFIEPLVNEQSRTIPVRIQVPNPGMRLRPGMFVQAAFAIRGGGRVLGAPRSAVIDTGTEKVVYIAKEGGLFERRKVELGTPGETSYPVISGLTAGERVVTHGTFLIDSQTRLTGGMTGMFGGSKSFDQPAAQSDLKVTLRTEPDPPLGSEENNVVVTVQEASGQAVSDAQVKVTIIMPAMPSMGMPEMRGSADLTWNGSAYTGKLNVAMGGPWNVAVEVRRGGQLLTTYRTRFDAR